MLIILIITKTILILIVLIKNLFIYINNIKKEVKI